MKNYRFFVDSLVKLGTITALVIGVTTKQEYSYYTFLRWTVMVTSIYFAYSSYDKKQTGLLIFFSATAVLFNPFIKFWLQRDTWHIVDNLVAFILFVTIIYDWTTRKK